MTHYTSYRTRLILKNSTKLFGLDVISSQNANQNNRDYFFIFRKLYYDVYKNNIQMIIIFKSRE